VRAASDVDCVHSSAANFAVDLLRLGAGKAVEHDAVLRLLGDLFLYQWQKGGDAVGVLAAVAKPHLWAAAWEVRHKDVNAREVIRILMNGFAAAVYNIYYLYPNLRFVARGKYVHSDNEPSLVRLELWNPLV